MLGQRRSQRSDYFVLARKRIDRFLGCVHLGRTDASLGWLRH